MDIPDEEERKESFGVISPIRFSAIFLVLVLVLISVLVLLLSSVYSMERAGPRKVSTILILF